MDRDQLTRKPDPDSKPGRRGREARGKDPGLNVPKKATLRVENSPSNNAQDDGEPTGESRRPVTNHEEQEKIFNADLHGDPLGEKEKEGD